MAQMLVVYITCEDREEAEKIGRHLLKKRLISCVNIIPNINSLFFWPPGKKSIDEAQEAVLLCHTLDEKWPEIEKEVLKIHTYKNPAIYAIPVKHVAKNYLNWLKSEIADEN